MTQRQVWPVASFSDMDAAAGPTHQPVLERVLSHLCSIEGISGLTLGGSRARGEGDAEADIDIGVYYYSRSRPDSAEMRAAANALDDRGQPSGYGDYGEWGPWINGGAWLRVDGHKTDLLFREIDRVEQVLADCEAGKIVTAYQPGHPHCFVNHIYAGEVHHNLILFDADGTLARMRKRTDPYPEPLAQALMRAFGWEAEFSVQIAGASARRGDVTYVAGCLFRAIACMTQSLFAANRTYLVNEKGAVRATEALDRRPRSFAERVTGLLDELGHTAPELQRALDTAIALQRETHIVLQTCGLTLTR